MSILDADIPDNAPPELKTYMEVKQFINEARTAMRELQRIVTKLENVEIGVQMKAFDALDQATGEPLKKYEPSGPPPVLAEGKRACSNCGFPGHRAKNCDKPPKNANVPMGKRACSICRKPGHRATSCPTKG